jgi:glycosyltransferase involved in cell wall biosynthesis
MQEDAFSNFRLQYACGDGVDALRHLLPSLERSLDDWSCADEEDRHLLQYADSLAYGWPDEARQASLILQHDGLVGAFAEAVAWDEGLLWLRSVRGGRLPWADTFGDWEHRYQQWLVEGGPVAPLLQGRIPRHREHLSHLARWRAFTTHFPWVNEALATPPTTLPIDFPWPQPPPLPKTPFLALLIEPVTIDWDRLLGSCGGQRILFLAPDAVTLQHCLAFSALHSAMTSGRDWFHVLDRYPADLLEQQPPLPQTEATLVAVARRPILDSYAEPLASALAALQKEGPHEGPAANHLFEVGRRLAWSLRGNRLGESRLFAHDFNCSQERWHSRHKGLPPHGAPLGPPQPSAALCLKRRFTLLPKKELKRIAHVVPQLVDGGHAPTRLYRTLARHHNHRSYEVHFLITEEYAYRTTHYPLPRYFSNPSTERGSEALRELERAGCGLWLADPTARHSKTAHLLGNELGKRAIDIAIFHTASAVGAEVAALSGISCVALFDHGSLAADLGYDLYLAATAEESDGRLDGPVVVLPHVVDVREGWLACPPPVGSFGVPSDAQLLTTISFHLQDRLSDAMCEAIATILERSPRAHYLPIGPISPSAQNRIRRPFDRRGVANRLHFLGAQKQPSHLARSMTLYLNEFPCGSGIALLDAMAAGLPIVSFYDPHGSHQARYAANAYGAERVIKGSDPADYVALACRLLQDPALHKEWSEAAIAAYEQRGSPKAYVSRLEQALEDHWRTPAAAEACRR